MSMVAKILKLGMGINEQANGQMNRAEREAKQAESK